jgi:hypothetical protein
VHVAAIVIGAVLMATGIGHLIASSFQLIELQSEVNEQLPRHEKFEPLFWSFFRLMRLGRLQQDVLPKSRRPRSAVRFEIIGFSLFFLGIALLLYGIKAGQNHEMVPHRFVNPRSMSAISTCSRQQSLTDCQA